jgi:hypothetical protein
MKKDGTFLVTRSEIMSLFAAPNADIQSWRLLVLTSVDLQIKTLPVVGNVASSAGLKFRIPNSYSCTVFDS